MTSIKKTQLKATDILKLSDGGFKYFKAIFPHLEVCDEDATKCYCVDSPFHDKKGTLRISVFQGKWQYYDNGGQKYHGDVFNFVSRTQGLNQKTEEFYEILRIVKETVEQQERPVQGHHADQEQLPAITYAPGYLTKILFKEYFGRICGDQPPAHFVVKLVDKAEFTVGAGDIVSLASDLEKNKVSYFSFSNAGTPGEMIYNRATGEVFHACADGSNPETFVFGWCESLLHMNFSCPTVAGNLIITNSIENVLLFQSLGYPAIALHESHKTPTCYLVDVILPQCPNARIFFDRSPELQAAAKELSIAISVPVIEFSRDMEDYVEQYESEYRQVFHICGFHVEMDPEHIAEYLNDFMVYKEI